MNQEAILFSLLIPESYLQAKPFDLVADMSEQIHNLPVQFSFIMRTSGIFLAVHAFVFLTGRPPGGEGRQHYLLHTDPQHRAPQRCVLSPLLCSLYIHDCVASHSSNSIIEFADDTTVVGLITNNDETAYREEVGTVWCQVTHLSLHVIKTQPLIVDIRKN